MREVYGVDMGGGGVRVMVTGNLMVEKKVEVSQSVHSGVDDPHCGEDLADQ